MSGRRLSLPGQILLLSLANLLLLVAAGLGFLSLQLGSGVESLLLGPVSDKMLGITMQTARALEALPQEQWDQMLRQLAARCARLSDYAARRARGRRLRRRAGGCGSTDGA